MGKVISFEDRVNYEKLVKKLREKNISYDESLLLNNSELVREMLSIFNYYDKL